MKEPGKQVTPRMGCIQQRSASCASPGGFQVILEHELAVPLPAGSRKADKAFLQERIRFHVLLTR